MQEVVRGERIGEEVAVHAAGVEAVEEAHQLDPRPVAHRVGPLVLGVQPRERVAREPVRVEAEESEAGRDEGERRAAPQPLERSGSAGEGHQAERHRDQDAVRPREGDEPAEEAGPAPVRAGRARDRAYTASSRNSDSAYTCVRKYAKGKTATYRTVRRAASRPPRGRLGEPVQDGRGPARSRRRRGRSRPSTARGRCCRTATPASASARGRAGRRRCCSGPSREVVAAPGDVEVPARVPRRERLREARLVERHREGTLGRAGARTTLATKVAAFSTPWTTRTAKAASRAARAHGVRRSARAIAAAAAARRAPSRRVSQDARGTAGATRRGRAARSNGFDGRRTLTTPRSKPPVTRYISTSPPLVAITVSTAASARSGCGTRGRDWRQARARPAGSPRSSGWRETRRDGPRLQAGGGVRS